MFTETLLLSPIQTYPQTHRDPLQYYMHTHLLRRAVFCLFSSPSHSIVSIHFWLPHFLRPALRKIDLQRNSLSRPWAHCTTQGFFNYSSRVNFTSSLSGGHFLRADWLTSDLRTHFKAFVAGVCWQNKIFQCSLFSGIIFFAWSRICSIALKFRQKLDQHISK